MPRTKGARGITGKQRDIVLKWAGLLTIEQIAVKAGLGLRSVRKIADDNGINLKLLNPVPKAKKPKSKGNGYNFTPENKPTIERPPAIYNNLPSPYGIAKN